MSDDATTTRDTTFSFEVVPEGASTKHALPTSTWEKKMEMELEMQRTTGTESSTVSMVSNHIRAIDTFTRKELSTLPREENRILQWGARGLRTSVLRNLLPSRLQTTVNSRQEISELDRLIDALYDGLRRFDHRRCLLILTYLLHARHLIQPDILNKRRYGATVVALTYSSNPCVAQCSRTLLRLWRYGLTKGNWTKELNARLIAQRRREQ